MAGFENYDFSKSADWQSYYQNIFPPPEYSKLLKIKQKWYKDHIDANYNPNLSTSSNPSSRPNPSRSNSQASPLSPPSSMQTLQVILFFLSIPGLLIGKALHCIIAGHLAGIIHYHDMPKLTAEYWKTVLTDDNLHSIAFALLFLIIPTQSLWIVPAYLGTLIYLADFLLKFRKTPESLKKQAQKVKLRTNEILQMRADCEVWIGFALIGLTVAGYSHWISPIIYWQYTRMRYVINYFSQCSFRSLNEKRYYNLS